MLSLQRNPLVAAVFFLLVLQHGAGLVPTGADSPPVHYRGWGNGRAGVSDARRMACKSKLGWSQRPAYRRAGLNLPPLDVLAPNYGGAWAGTSSAVFTDLFKVRERICLALPYAPRLAAAALLNLAKEQPGPGPGAVASPPLG